MNYRLILLNKPFGTICQFSDSGGKPTLADWVKVPAVYPAGRLDTDSEGLVLLTDDGRLQSRIADPRHKLEKVYWAQVEGCPRPEDLAPVEKGLDLGDFRTAPARARLMQPPADLWDRHPPIRHRAALPTSWVELVLSEGKNRQVRRMTARLGFPTLRLIRWRVGPWTLSGLAPGAWRDVDPVLPPGRRGRADPSQGSHLG